MTELLKDDFEYPLSNNAMKYAYFEAATLYHIEDSEHNRSVCYTKYKLLNSIMFDAAKAEEEALKHLFLMLIIHEAAKQYEDFETMGKVLTDLRNRKWGKDETALIDLHSKTPVCLLMSPKTAVHLAINAGVKIQEAVTELEDLAFMVDDGEVEL